MLKARRLAAAALILLQAGAASAADEAFELFSHEARVLTASRRLEAVWQAPVAVEVVTAQEIRDSGAVNLWDFMRFRAGMNVVDGRSGEGNRALVSVRGFPAEFVDNLLVLVDGRSVYTGLSGGAVWEQLPVQVQDIERIEIVRGPSAALYGSNAGLGVVNIITRRPEGRLALSGETLGGASGLHREQVSVEDGWRSGAYRLSLAHKEQAGHPTTTGGRGQDYLYSQKGNVRARWSPGPRAELELLAGGSWENLGVIDPASPAARARHHFELLRHSFQQAPDSAFETTLSRRDDWREYDKTNGERTSVREHQYDASVEHKLDWAEGRHHTVYGASLRYTAVESAQIFAGHPYQKNAISRGFASQSWQALPRLNLVGAASVENSDSGGVEPAYQVAAVARPWDGHVFRASHGLAPTIPTLYQRSARQQADANTLLVGDPAIMPQRLRSYELSYQGRAPDQRATWETNFFYMRVDRLSQTVVRSYVFPVLTLTFNNGNNAIARGVEVKGGYRWGPRTSAYANYTYETVSDAKGSVNVSKGTPPHKLNLGGAAALGRGVHFGLNAGYQDGHTLYSQAATRTLDIPAYWRLDGRLAWEPTRDWTVFVACQNMAAETHLEFADGLAVPRTYQAGVSVRFDR